MPDFLPRPDTDFATWFRSFVAYVIANAANLGVTPAQVTDLQAVFAAWEANFAQHIAAMAAARGARVAKDEQRQAATELIRQLVRQMQASPLVDANERKSLGINLADTIPTATGIPDSSPTCMINAGQRLRHTSDFRNATTPTRRRKPPGVLGVEIYIRITNPGEPAPLDPAEFAYHGIATSSPYRIDFAGTDGIRIVHYILRWINTRGQKGPWSGSRRNLRPQFENGSPRFV